MAQNEHERAVKEALRTTETLRALFGRLGTAEHPRGRVLAAYRQARRALKGSDGNLALVREVLAELRSSLQLIAQATLWEAAQAGSQQAQKQIALYGLAAGLDGYTPAGELSAWMAMIDAQLAAVQGIAVGGGGLSAIIGDEHRVGALSPAPVIRDGARWLAVATMAGLAVATSAAIDRSGARDEFGKQAVAAIDHRTTDTCLRVHGQVVPVNGQFTLTGTPRYADKMEHSPFHPYCRTAEAIVRMRDANDALTRAMRQAAINEQRAQAETGEKRYIRPASATSSR